MICQVQNSFGSNEIHIIMHPLNLLLRKVPLEIILAIN